MIKLPYKSICGLSKLCFLLLAMLCVNQSSAQIVINWPDFLNNNSGGLASETESISLSGCTSISFSMEYITDEYAGGGMNNLESADECSFGDPCNGDPLNPAQGDCEFCWDFLIFEFEVNGAFEFGDFIGTTNVLTSNSYSWDSGCIDPNDTYDLDLAMSSQTWQGTEDIDVINMVILCYQGIAEDDLTIDPVDDLCVGDNLNLEVSSAFTDAEWYFEGTNIGMGTNIDINGIGITQSGTYWVETTDDNGCGSSVEFDIMVEEIPMSCPVVSIIEACIGGSGFVEIDLTQYDAEVNCFESDDVLWFENPGDIPDFPIIDPTTYESDGSDLYAVVWNGTCYSSEQLVFIDTGSGIDPDIDIDATTICEGENLVFEVINISGCSNCEFEWDGPAGSGISGDVTPSEIYQVLNANSPMTGTWVVTVTDDTGCSGTASIDVIVVGQPEGTISGGGDLCPGFCTDATNELTLDLSGGTGPYDVVINVSSFGIDVDIPLPAFLPNGTITLCVDPSPFVIPSITSDFDGDGNNDLIVPNIPFDFSISLTNIVDANGCQGTGTGTISYTINPTPDANEPGGPYELCAGTPFDLTTYNDNINGALTILWFEDMDLTMPIVNPDAYTPGATPTTVYAVADNGTCTSEPVSLELTIIPAPVLDPIDDVTACEVYDFVQPSGMDVGTNVVYTDASGIMYGPGDITNQSGMYTLTAGDNPACAATETFVITILDLPSIVNPTTEISSCGEIILPMIDVLNFDVATGTVGYFEGAGQSGVSYAQGETIDQASGITSIFVYVGNPGCFDQVEIDLIFSSDIEYVLPAYPTDACGDFELLPIGGATAGVAYFTEEDGGGVQYNVGEFLPAPGTYTLYLYDPTIDQTCVLNSNVSFTITLEAEPIIDPLPDVTVCSLDGFILPTITGLFTTGDEGYANAMNGGGTLFMAGDTIFDTSTIFIYNTAASCPATEVVFEVNVVLAPNAGDTGDFETCIGPTINLNTYLSAGADLGGTFAPEDGSIVLSGAENNIWDTSTADENTPYIFSYLVVDASGVCSDVSVDLSITLTNDVSAGVALPDSTICSGDLIDLFGLIDGESTGGYFLEQNNLMDTIFSGEWMADGQDASFSYIIEAADGCNGDQSSFDVMVIDAQMVSVDIPDFEVCEGNCIEMTINSNFETDLEFQLVDIADSGEMYDLTVSVDGVQVVQICADGNVGDFNNNTISLGDEGEQFVISFATIQGAIGCETNLSNLGNYNFEMINVFQELIIGEVCEGEGFMYQGEEYFDDIILTGFTSAGCDSTTTIEIVEFAPAENFENSTYCIGTIVEIGGETYTETEQDELLLEGASANGCDSIIYIDIAFDLASYNDVVQTICETDDIEVGGTTYDIDNPSGTDTLFNGSVQGCDSIITVSLEFYDIAIGEENQMICEGDTINILGQDFYSGMEQMDVTLQGASANDCDSIVSVSIDFLPANQVTEEYEVCAGETLEVNGFEISEANLTGIYTLDGSGTDCPTVVSYTTELFSSVMIVIDTSICEGETIEINGITFSDSYTFDESINQTVNGCDSTVIISVNIEEATISSMSELIGANEYQMNYLNSNISDPIWSSDIGALSCEACESPTITIVEDTEVYLSAMTAAGCLVVDTIFLSFLPEPVFVGIYAPNVFSPDDDNLNQIYTIYGTGGFVISEMNIYDRWGNEVYATGEFLPNEEVVGWNGRIDGVKAEVGVYVGRIIYVEPDGMEKVLVFDLTLIR